MRLHRLAVDDTVAIVGQSVESGEKTLFVDQNLHGIYMLGRDPAFAKLHALPEALVRVDGLPLILLARMSGYHFEVRHRVTWLDLVWPLLDECAAKSWRVFFLGGTSDVAEHAAEAVKKRLPGIIFEAASGYFDKTQDSDGNRATLERLAAFGPNVLLVGMGMGVQEKWLLENLPSIPANAIFTVGALFEYLTGTVKTPPRWIGRFGFEWLFRLVENPRRFWFRYLIEPIFVAKYLAQGAWRQRASRRLQP